MSAQLLGQAWSTWEKRLADGQTKFDFRELPPGDYNVYIQSKPEREPQHEGMFTQRSLANQRVWVKAGETKAVAF